MSTSVINSYNRVSNDVIRDTNHDVFYNGRKAWSLDKGQHVSPMSYGGFGNNRSVYNNWLAVTEKVYQYMMDNNIDELWVEYSEPDQIYRLSDEAVKMATSCGYLSDNVEKTLI